MPLFEKIDYAGLNSRQKENYNFQKLAAVLADYGFNCMWLNDDWEGADFIAYHVKGEKLLRVQLKSRLTIDNKYKDKEIYVAFQQNAKWYLYPHDQLRDELLKLGLMQGSKSWEENEGYSWPNVPQRIREHMDQYIIEAAQSSKP